MSLPGQAPSARVELELVLGAEPIRGTIRTPGLPEASFSGWLELLATLEQVRNGQVAPGTGDEAPRAFPDPPRGDDGS